MVQVTKENNDFKFQIKGLHKLWAVKSEINIPAEHIVKAYRNEDEISSFVGIRMPGTHIPGIITAGSFMVDGGTIFCDFSNRDNLVIVELKDEKYKKLVIEVENVSETLKVFQ
ncbi:MAG: hypothetical protein U0T68_12390 [Ferruginibacter sp.]